MMEIVQETDGYSGADMTNLCKDAAMGPIRSLDYSKIESIDTLDVRPIRVIDFRDALRQVKASVSDRDLALYLDWNNKFGSGK
jgi:ATPases of the AAA+ class